jgi:four helix bundle protein
MARSYGDLLVWRKAKELAVQIHRATDSFPRDQLYGLTSQLRRAAVSIPSNIAEGQGRLTNGEFSHFLGLARGSLLEVDTQLAIAVDLQLMNTEVYAKLDHHAFQILGLLNRLIESMQQRRSALTSRSSKP